MNDLFREMEVITLLLVIVSLILIFKLKYDIVPIKFLFSKINYLQLNVPDIRVLPPFMKIHTNFIQRSKN